MPVTALIRKPIQSKGVDLALCKRLAQNSVSSCVSSRELDHAGVRSLEPGANLSRSRDGTCRDLAEKDAAELRQLTAALVYELKS